MKKKEYEKPAMQVFELKTERLLMMSDLDRGNPYGDPLNPIGW